MSFCRGGRSRLFLTDCTSHSIPVLIPSLGNKRKKKFLSKDYPLTGLFMHGKKNEMKCNTQSCKLNVIMEFLLMLKFSKRKTNFQAKVKLRTVMTNAGPCKDRECLIVHSILFFLLLLLLFNNILLVFFCIIILF